MGDGGWAIDSLASQIKDLQNLQRETSQEDGKLRKGFCF